MFCMWAISYDISVSLSDLFILHSVWQSLTPSRDGPVDVAADIIIYFF